MAGLEALVWQQDTNLLPTNVQRTLPAAPEVAVYWPAGAPVPPEACAP